MKYIVFFCSLFSICLGISAQEQKVTPKTFSATGTLFSQYTSGLSSRVSGRILKVQVDVGSHVKKGDVLLTIDPLFFKIDVAQAEAHLAAAKVDVSDAEINYQRMNKLWNKPDGISPSISRKRFEDAEYRYKQEKAHLQQAEEDLKKAQALLDETVIRAPYDGSITKRLVHPGESVRADSSQKLLEIESCDAIYVEFSVPQALLPRISIGTPITVETEKGTRNTTITVISPHIDEKTRSIKCRANLDNTSHELHSGALVTIHGAV